MRPYLEKLPTIPGASWGLLNRRLDDAIPFQWHHHPEYELTLTLNSRGQRFIGDHVGFYGDGDLVLVGPNLPHTWASREKIERDGPHVALVMWFDGDWAARLSDGFVELQPIGELMRRARCGLHFSAVMAQRLRPQIEALFAAPVPERLLLLVRVLMALARDGEAEPLASASVPLDVGSEDRARIDRVLTHIHTHYAEPIRNGELAALAALSLSGLHRLFARHTRTTISDYVMRLRVGDACARLSGTRQPVRHIAEAVGYNALANFNRQFKALRGMTPSEYRALFKAG
ncbi:AraC family transcriptional regulator [Nitratireductor sp. ZSWI3]|uniref:AraC family transcriptional regulator n=1 Tax=Nitratireductor sp. ZSWI3 TaxID=2966359 RepID=UPI002150491C|nr:AraC family transcriptional regulator [Nitratireductor sp. ZSWI3]MCR4268032.1 AraC family transcriptional regulator [Nitratireductor sp. ZSWI3]